MAGGITLEFKEIDKIGFELITYEAVQIRGDVHRRDLPHAGKTMMIAAGQTAEDFFSQADAGSLDHVDQRTRSKKMISEAFRLLVPDIFRAGAIMAEDNVAEFTGQRTLDKDLGQLLVIGDDIQLFPVFQTDGGEGVLVLFAKGINHAPTIMGHIFGKILIGDNQDAGDLLQNG